MSSRRKSTTTDSVAGIVKTSLKRCASAVGRLLVDMRMLPRRSYVKVDGGICSQMHFYLVGRILARRGHEVRFDTTWYRDSGMDSDGRFCRNFDILKVFPDLDFPIDNTGLIRWLYTKAFYRRNDYYDTAAKTDWQQVSVPVFFDGYFRDSDDMYGKLFDETFVVDTSVLPEDNLVVLSAIDAATRDADSCAVHIRRGDLARYEKAYGEPATAEYFKAATAAVRAENPDVRFFLFSDEPDWCRSHVVPLLGDGEVTVVDVNGSDRGWCDLILMSRCRHHVTSQGSMGKYAALLRTPALRDGLVVLPPNATSSEWTARFAREIAVSG